VDLRFPLVVPGRATPLIVLIHGGFLAPSPTTARTWDPMGHALAAAGYMVAVPEYRRAGMARRGLDGNVRRPSSRWPPIGCPASPGHTAPIPALVTWAGHSAGGHLALWAAARPGLPLVGGPDLDGAQPSPAPNVVSLAGCTLVAAVRGVEPGRGVRSAA